MCPTDDPPDNHDPDSHDPDPQSAEDQDGADIGQVVRELLLHDGDSLPPRSAARIRALAQAAVEPLLAVLVDTKLRNPTGPASGWGPVHAARLLGELSPERALEPFLDVLATTTPPTPLFGALFKALSLLGAQLVAPILARLPSAVGSYRRELWFLLAGVGVHDPRVLATLLGTLAESPEEGAMCLADYGDKAALPDLSRALDAYRAELADDPAGDHTVFELREAIMELGGTLTPSQEAKYERALGARRLDLAVRSRVEHEPQSSEDAPCRCGSGRLYKQCCLH